MLVAATCRTVLFALSLGTSPLASPAPEEGWRTVAEGEIHVRVRERPDTPVHEVWAEGEMAAAPEAIRDALMDSARFSRFMPYVKESRWVSSPSRPGTRLTYILLSPPV